MNFSTPKIDIINIKNTYLNLLYIEYYLNNLDENLEK
jgi:hypothetical protein